MYLLINGILTVLILYKTFISIKIDIKVQDEMDTLKLILVFMNGVITFALIFSFALILMRTLTLNVLCLNKILVYDTAI